MAVVPPSAPGLPRLSRRALLRAAGTGSALSLATGYLTACRAAGRSAAPTPTNPRVTVVFSPIPWEANQAALNALYDHILQPFYKENPDVRVRFVYQQRGNATGTAAAIVAGTAADVFEDYQIFGILAEAGYLLDLTPFMQRDNVDTSIFPQSQLASLRIGGAQYGLPVSIESVVAAVNLGILDEMGLAAPDDGWDYKAAEKLFRATTVTGHDEKTHRYGGAFYFYAEYYPEEYYLRQFGGSYVDPQDAGKCNLSAEGSIACGEYIYPLLQEGICTTDWAYSGKFPNNLLTVGLCGSFMLPQFAAYPATLKYRFMPLPKGPVMGATFGSPAFYAIPSTTKVADAAWRLLRWMSFEPDFQQANMKFGLLPPASLKLYGDFVDVVKAVAPPLRDKNVEAFSAWVTDGHAFPDPFFKYNTGSAFNLLNTDLAKILTAHASVRETFVQAAAHVDAYEAVAAAQQTSVASAERRFPTSGPAIAAVPEGV